MTRAAGAHPHGDGLDADEFDEDAFDAYVTEALHDLRRTRRRNRLATIHWIDALYRVYVAAVVGIVIVLLLSSLIGDAELTDAQLDTVRAEGPAVVGLAVALVAALALRSGSRGGPLALEKAEVRQVLLAPVPHQVALRHPAFQQLRFATFVGGVVGAIAGQLAVRRLGGAPLAWVAVGLVFGALLGVAAIGLALLCSGWRLPRAATTAVWIVLVGWAVGDVTNTLPASPTSFFGAFALWPIGVDWWALPALAVAVAVVVAGWLAMGGLPVEAAERRASLVGQLRFAATVQDLRTVIVLRRQLAQEFPRQRPWLRLRRSGRHAPVWRRDWHGFLRFPAERLVRLGILAVVAGLALRLTWDGTTPLIVLAGLAFYVAGVEAAEPLAQEVDNGDRTDSLPLAEGDLHLRHLPAAGVAALVVGAVAAGAAATVGPPAVAIAACATAAMSGAIAGLAAGVGSVVMGAPEPDTSGTEALMPPEVAGLKVAVRTAWPPALAVVGCLPLLATRVSVDAGDPAFQPTSSAVIGVLFLVTLVVAYVRYRGPLKEWWAQASAEARQQSGLGGRPEDTRKEGAS